jgi:hypothetical protein
VPARNLRRARGVDILRLASRRLFLEITRLRPCLGAARGLRNIRDGSISALPALSVERPSCPREQTSVGHTDSSVMCQEETPALQHKRIKKDCLAAVSAVL